MDNDFSPKINLTSRKDLKLIGTEQNKGRHIKHLAKARCFLYNVYMKLKKVGVIRGGKKHYEASIKEGGELISHLISFSSHKFRPVDILIDKAGFWHASGLPVKVSELKEKADAFWDTTRSDAYMFLEDPAVVNVSGGYSSFSGDTRKAFGEHLKKTGIKIPRHVVFPAYQKDFDGQVEDFITRKVTEVLEKFSPPWRVRLFPGNPKAGARLVKTAPELAQALAEGVKYEKSILVEEFINGPLIPSHSVLGFRSKDVYVFPSIEKVVVDKEKLYSLAKDLHECVPGAYYVNSGFVLNPQKGVYLVELEFSPDLGENSHFSESCKAIGVRTHNVIEHILEQSF